MDSDVLIKVAADISTAVSAMQQLAETFKQLGEGLKAAGDQSEAAGEQTQSFWDRMMNGSKASAESTVAWGQQLDKVYDQVKDGINSAVKAFPNMIEGSARLGESMHTMSARLGVSAEAIETMSYIADQANVPMEGMARTAQTLGIQLMDGGSKASKAFAEMGLNAEELRKKPEEALLAFTKGLQGIEDPAERNAKFIEVLGGKARLLTPLLGENIDVLKDEAKALGMTADETAVLSKEGDAWFDNLGKIHKAQETFKNHIAIQLLPTMNKLAEAMPGLGGGLLVLGEGVMDVAKKSLPILQTGLMKLISDKGLKGATAFLKKEGAEAFADFGGMITKAGSAIMGIVPMIETFLASIGGMSGILAALPWVALIAALTAVGVLLWNLAGGWDGIKKSMEPVVVIFEDLWTAGKKLVDDVFKGLVDWTNWLIAGFDKLYDATVKLAKEAFAWVITSLQNLIGWLEKLPVVGAVVDGVKTAFEELAKLVDKVWGTVKGFIETTKGWLGGVTTQLHAYAEGIRATEAPAKGAADAHTDLAKAVAPLPSALDKMMAAAAEADKVVKGLTQTQKDQIKTLTEAGNSTKDIADAMKAHLGPGGVPVSVEVATAAIDKFKDSLKASKKEAKETDFEKLVHAGNDLSKAMNGAGAAGISAAEMVTQFGKQAYDAYVKASLVPGALEQLPQNVKDIAYAFERADLETVLKKIADQAKKAGAALIGVSSDMEQRNQALIDSYTHLAQLETAAAAQSDKLHLTSHQLALKQIDEQEKAELDMARGRAVVNEAEVKAIQAKYETQRQIENKATGDFETDMKLRGVTTKQAAQDQLAIEQQKLKELEDLHDPFYAKQIAAQRKVVEDSKLSSGKVKVDWLGAMQSMTDSFEQLANISGDTFGGITKSVGTTLAGITGMAKGVSDVFGQKDDGKGGKTGLLGQIGGAFAGGKANADGTSKTGVMGMLSGAMGAIPVIGQAISGVIGIASMAIDVGKKMWDMFTKSGGEKQAADIGRDFGVKVTEEMGNAINKDAKDLFNGDRFAANIYHMSDIIKEAGGVNAKNVDTMLGRLHDVFSMLESGKFTVEQATKVLDDNFGAFAKNVTDSGKVASKEFTNIIALNAQFGTQSKAVMDFVGEQTGRLGTSLASLAGVQDQTNESMGRFERLAVAGFNAALAAGVPYLDAMNQMGPALDKIVEQNKALGREGGAAINELLRFREVTQANQELVESASSLNDVMLALSNTGGLNVDTMADLQAQGTETYAKLLDAGFTEQQSLQQMKAYLEQVRNAHEELALPIDENTQALINQAEEQGILKEKQMSTNDIMLQGLGAIIDALGGKMPAAFKTMTDAATGSAKTIEKSLKTQVNDPLDVTTKKLNETPWDTFAATSVKAGAMANQSMESVNASVGAVSGSLGQIDWRGWSSEAITAAEAAQAAVDAVSLGHSPGGIKEMPIKLKEATASFKDWSRVSVSSADSVKEAVDDVSANEMTQRQLALSRQTQMAVAAAGGVQGGNVTIEIPISVGGTQFDRKVIEVTQRALNERRLSPRADGVRQRR